MGMKDIFYQDFQNAVSELLTRHKSILDILTKFTDSHSRVNRAVVKSSTSCGCIEIHAKKQQLPQNASLEEMKKYMKTHITGDLCPSCRDTIEKELGNHMFYVASLANTLGISLYDTLLKEQTSLSALGKFHLK